MDEPTNCPACDGEESSYLGGLGNFLWYRCRFCGLEYRHKVEAVGKGKVS